MLRHERAELVIVQIVFSRELVVGALHEGQFRRGYAERVKDGSEDELIVFRSMGDEV